MKLIIDGYTRELRQQEAVHGAPPGMLIGSGEYLYHNNDFNFVDHGRTPQRCGATENDCWRQVLYEALLKFPAVEVEGTWFGLKDWKLEVLCSSQEFVNYGTDLLASLDEGDELTPFLGRFAHVSFSFATPARIEAELASYKQFRQECY